MARLWHDVIALECEKKHSDWHWWKNGKNNVTSCTKCSLPENIRTNFNSTLVICWKFVFIEMLDKLITYIVWWYKTVYQVLSVAWTNPSQLVAIVTRSDTGSHNRLDLIQSLAPPHYVWNGYICKVDSACPFSSFVKWWFLQMIALLYVLICTCLPFESSWPHPVYFYGVFATHRYSLLSCIILVFFSLVLCRLSELCSPVRTIRFILHLLISLL